MWYSSRLVLGLIVIAFQSNCVAQSDLVRIEEHWELTITEADRQTNAPQVMLHFSPFGEDSDFHFELDLNHASLPQYSPGGFQVRAMQGEKLLSEARLLSNVRFDAAAETISWIQIAQKQPSGWAFAVGFGTSQSWGNFGGPETIVSIPQADLRTSYNPQDSITASGVIFAKNRVDRLTLKKVRLYYGDNQSRDVSVGVSVQ